MTQKSLLRKLVATFLHAARLWIFMLFTFVVAKVGVDLAYHGLIDLRQIARAELLWVPTVQAALFWLVTLRRRSRFSRTTERRNPADA